MAQFEQVVRNCPNSTLKASLEMSPAGADWTTSLLALKEIPRFEARGSTVSIGLFFFVGQRFFLPRPRPGHGHDQVEQSHQEETEEEKAEKKFWLPVHEEKKAQHNNDYDNGIVLSKRNDAVHGS